MPEKKIIKCLVVDDEPPAREIIRRYIEEMPVLELAAQLLTVQTPEARMP